MKHYGFPGRAYIGWNRICRPGAILGPQQQFLVEMHHEMRQQGLTERANLRQQHLGNHHFNNNAQGNRQSGLTAEQAKEDVGQGDRLTATKRSTGGSVSTASGSMASGMSYGSS